MSHPTGSFNNIPPLTPQQRTAFSSLLARSEQAIAAYNMSHEAEAHILNMSQALEDFARPHQPSGQTITSVLEHFTLQVRQGRARPALTASEMFNAATQVFIGHLNEPSMFAPLLTELDDCGARMLPSSRLIMEPPKETGVPRYMPKLRTALTLLMEQEIYAPDIEVHYIDPRHTNGPEGLRDHYTLINIPEHRLQVMVCDRINAPTYVRLSKGQRSTWEEAGHRQLQERRDIIPVLTTDYSLWKKHFSAALEGERNNSFKPSPQMFDAMIQTGIYTSLRLHLRELQLELPKENWFLPPEKHDYRSQFYALHTGISSRTLLESQLKVACDEFAAVHARPATIKDGAIPGWGGITFAEAEFYLLNRTRQKKVQSGRTLNEATGSLTLAEFQQLDFEMSRQDAHRFLPKLVRLSDERLDRLHYMGGRRTKEGVFTLCLQHLRETGHFPQIGVSVGPNGENSFWETQSQFLSRKHGQTLQEFIQAEVRTKIDDFRRSHSRSPRESDGDIKGWPGINWGMLQHAFETSGPRTSHTLSTIENGSSGFIPLLLREAHKELRDNHHFPRSSSVTTLSEQTFWRRRDYQLNNLFGLTLSQFMAATLHARARAAWNKSERPPAPTDHVLGWPDLTWQQIDDITTAIPAAGRFSTMALVNKADPTAKLSYTDIVPRPTISKLGKNPHNLDLYDLMRALGSSVQPLAYQPLEPQPLAEGEAASFSPKLRAVLHGLLGAGEHPGNIRIYHPLVYNHDNGNELNNSYTFLTTGGGFSVAVCNRNDAPTYVIRNSHISVWGRHTHESLMNSSKAIALTGDTPPGQLMECVTRILSGDTKENLPLPRMVTPENNKDVLAESGMFLTPHQLLEQALGWAKAHNGIMPGADDPGPAGQPGYWAEKKAPFCMKSCHGFNLRQLFHYKLKEQLETALRETGAIPAETDAPVPGLSGMTWAQAAANLRNVPRKERLTLAELVAQPADTDVAPELLDKPFLHPALITKGGISCVVRAHVAAYERIPTVRSDRGPDGSDTLWLRLDKWLTKNNYGTLYEHTLLTLRQDLSDYAGKNGRQFTAEDGELPGWPGVTGSKLQKALGAVANHTMSIEKLYGQNPYSPTEIDRGIVDWIKTHDFFASPESIRCTQAERTHWERANWHLMNSQGINLYQRTLQLVIGRIEHFRENNQQRIPTPADGLVAGWEPVSWAKLSAMVEKSSRRSPTSIGKLAGVDPFSLENINGAIIQSLCNKTLPRQNGSDMSAEEKSYWARVHVRLGTDHGTGLLQHTLKIIGDKVRAHSIHQGVVPGWDPLRWHELEQMTARSYRMALANFTDPTRPLLPMPSSKPASPKNHPRVA